MSFASVTPAKATTPPVAPTAEWLFTMVHCWISGRRMLLVAYRAPPPSGPVALLFQKTQFVIFAGETSIPIAPPRGALLPVNTQRRQRVFAVGSDWRAPPELPATFDSNRQSLKIGFMRYT